VLRLDHQIALLDGARAALARVGLDHLADRPLAQTAYGERRRIEIAMALAQNPKVLLLDEPFAGLSIEERRDVQQLLAAIPRDVTIVMIEHDMDVALDFAERITVLHFGEVVVEGTRAEIAAQGVALVPQGRRIFRSLSVRENLVVAAHKPRGGLPLLWTLDTVFATFPRLQERRDQYAGTLSGGEQQMLAIGRALMSNPRVLLMDEPSEGLAPQIVAEVMATIRRLKEEGLSIVLVEQNAKLVFDIADDIVILNRGHVAVSGRAGE